MNSHAKMSTGILGTLVALIGVCLLVLVLAGCENTMSAEPLKLPANARVVTDKGNGWTTFELDGTKYLYHRSTEGSYRAFEAITAIPRPPKTWND